MRTKSKDLGQLLRSLARLVAGVLDGPSAHPARPENSVPSFALISPEKHGGNAELFSIFIAEGKRRGGCVFFCKRRGGCVFFCNRRDARVRAQRGLASQVGTISLSASLTQNTGRVLRTHQRIEMGRLSHSRSFFSDSFSRPSWIPLPVQGEGKRAWRARVRAVATSTSLSTPCVKTGFVPKLLSSSREIKMRAQAVETDFNSLL